MLWKAHSASSYRLEGPEDVQKVRGKKQKEVEPVGEGKIEKTGPVRI